VWGSQFYERWFPPRFCLLPFYLLPLLFAFCRALGVIFQLSSLEKSFVEAASRRAALEQ
jgi:hypothetical protein